MPHYFFSRDGTTQEGPIEAEAFMAMLRSGGLSHNSKVWREGLADWVRAGELPEVRQPAANAEAAGVVATAPPMVPGPLGAPGSGRADGLAVASLVLGCVSLVGSCLHGLVLPLAITGLILGIVSTSRGGVRTAGIVTNSIAVALACFFGVIVIIALTAGKP